MDTEKSPKEEKESESFATPKKELDVLSSEPFTFKMSEREVSLRPICLGDLSYIIDSIFELISTLTKNNEIKIDQLTQGVLDPSVLVLLQPAQKALLEILARLTGQTEDFLEKLSLVDLSILIRAFAEQNHLEMLVENFRAVASRMREAVGNLG